MILHAYKVQLDADNKQQPLLFQHIGCARFAPTQLGWALAKMCALSLSDESSIEFNENIPEPKHGDHIPIKDFIDMVIHRWFIDYDGHGYLATETKVSNVLVFPSEMKIIQPPNWVTHIVWYNR